MRIWVDDRRTRELVLQAAYGGLRRAAEFCLGRARYHAPVRAVFKRTRRGPEIPRGTNVKGYEKSGWRYIRSESQYQAFIRSKERRIGMARGANEDTQMALEELRRVQMGGTMPRRGERLSEKMRSGAGVTGRGANRLGGTLGARFTGHNNTLFPVFRTASGTKTTGDFRRWGGPQEVIRQRRGEQSRLIGDRFKEGSEVPKWEHRLSSRGRREFADKSGPGGLPRALYHGRIGGRLRGELHVSGPEIDNGTVWIYVGSPTEYSIHQEFGTTRHRAQPFLRPALYESRNILRTEVRKAITDFRSDAVYRGDRRPTYRKRMID
jgi:hypothetical protein